MYFLCVISIMGTYLYQISPFVKDNGITFVNGIQDTPALQPYHLLYKSHRKHFLHPLLRKELKLSDYRMD